MNRYSYPAQVWALAEKIALAVRTPYHVGWFADPDSGEDFQHVTLEGLTRIIADVIMHEMKQAEANQ